MGGKEGKQVLKYRTALEAQKGLRGGDVR